MKYLVMMVSLGVGFRYEDVVELCQKVVEMEPDKQVMSDTKEKVVSTVRRRNLKTDKVTVEVSIPRGTTIIGGMSLQN